MHVFHKLRNMFTVKHATDTTGKEYDPYQSYSGIDEVTLAQIMDGLKRDPQFAMIVRGNTDYTVGHGFYLSANSDAAKSQTALQIIEDFCDEADMDMLLQECCIDAWACGNFFLQWTTDGLLHKIPASEIQQVNVDDMDKPVSYRRIRGGHKMEDVPADEILHFRFQRLDISPLGEGLGQQYMRRGYPYRDFKNKTRTSPNIFQINGMMRHVIPMIFYAGLPRWFINIGKEGPESVKDVASQMRGLDPLQHMVTNNDVSIQETALSPSNKMDAYFRQLDNQNIMAGMSPLPTLWKDMSSFAYASADAAIESSLPLIDAMQRALKAFIEKSILRPILETNDLDWKKHKVSIHFGREEVMSLDQIADLVSILDRSHFNDKYDPDDILDMIRDAGYNLKSKSPQDMIRDMQRHKRYQNTANHTLKRPTPKSSDDLKKLLYRRYRG